MAERESSKFIARILRHKPEAIGITLDEQGWVDVDELIPKSRLYVHLTENLETAVNVGRRHGKPIVYAVLAGRMQSDGYDFFKSVNGVWLTRTVPVKYLEKQ